MQILNVNCKQFENIKSKSNQVQSHFRLKRAIRPSVKLGLWCIKWIEYQQIGYFSLETDCIQVANQWRVNADSLSIHVSRQFLLVNTLYKPFGNV